MQDISLGNPINLRLIESNRYLDSYVFKLMREYQPLCHMYRFHSLNTNY